MKKLAEGKQRSNAQLLAKAMDPERLLVRSN